MLFDRFNFRERESGMPEDDPTLSDLPPEPRTYAFTLDSRQIVFLVAGYCFLCVLVFALGMVVGRATSQPEAVTKVAKSEESPPSLPQEQPAKGQSKPSSAGRIPLMPTVESKKAEVQVPEFAFSPTLPESALTSKSESFSAAPPPRPKASMAPEVVPGSEPPPVAVKAPEKPEPEPRRSAAVSESKPKPAAAAHTSLGQGGDYTIQVGSSRSLEQATELKGRLSKKGYTAYVQTVDLSDKGTWHRVRVGAYRDKEGAERVAMDIRNRESLPATVMKK
jgi:cell division septation protein DedD